VGLKLMAKASRAKASSRAQARRWNAAARRMRLQNILKRKRQVLIPSNVLQMLQAMHLPKDCQAYNAKLRELLGT
jgi:hypothetical protein